MKTDSPHTHHVLALDDDPAIRQLVADYLVQNERHVTTVASGRELTAVMASETTGRRLGISRLLDGRPPGARAAR